MSVKSQSERGPTQRSVEIGVTVCTAAFALIVLAGSIQVGVGWGAEGPKAGFFPFYVALLILASSVINLAHVLSGPRSNRLFAEWGHLVQVISLLVPTAIYVVLIPWSGIYVASALLIAVFMKWLGDYGWGMVAAVSIGVPLVTFIIFEKWFLVSLPKGPIEEYLGF
jgi:putative tricarboxylic transport membrane protein